MTEQKKISTTQLAKKRGIAQAQLFSDLSNFSLNTGNYELNVINYIQ